MERFADQLGSEGLSPRTIEAYRLDVQRLEAHLGCGSKCRPALTQVSLRNLISYRDSLLARGLKPSTVRRHFVSIGRFFSWLEQTRQIDWSPAAVIRVPSVASKVRRRRLRAEQITSLVRAAQQTGLPRDRLRNELIVSLLSQAGLRLQELIAVRWSDLTPCRTYLEVFGGTPLQQRTVPLSSDIRCLLNRWTIEVDRRIAPHPVHIVAGADGNALSRRAVQHLLTRLGQAAGVSGAVAPSDLRQSFARSYLRQNPGDLHGLAKLMGHRSVHCRN